MASAAVAAAIAAGEAIVKMIPTYRQCAICIDNKTKNYILSEPRMYTYSGHCKEPLTPVIGPSDGGGGVFVKTSYTACGSVGVITYDLQRQDTGQTEKIALMFSVPFNFNFYSNLYAVGIFDENTPCNYDLYKKMYYDSGPFIRGKARDGEIRYGDSDVNVIATMSDEYTPVIKLQIFD
uniref:Uncharacterized protein n=2 Tax=Sphaeramia orbicularis TaxID=375764 RepID=A0A673A707_9TELE